MNHSQSSRLTVWSAFTPLDGPHTFPRAGFDRRVVNFNASPSWPFPLTGPAFALFIIDGRRWRRSWGIRAQRGVAPPLNHWLLDLPWACASPTANLLGYVKAILPGLQEWNQLCYMLALPLRFEATALLGDVLDNLKTNS